MSIQPSAYTLGFHDPEEYLARLPKGLTEETVRAISAYKQEPEWMLEHRLAGFKAFKESTLPTWGADLSGINFDEITYFLRATDRPAASWDEVPDTIKTTFDRIGVPQAERDFLAGVGAQYESEVVYHNLQEKWSSQGVIFVDMDTAVREYPELVQQYFGTVIPATDNPLAALNTAVWSGGSFVYVPEGVSVTVPLQAYFRINAVAAGQFERTIIIGEPGSHVHYVEGCSAPIYARDSLHAAVVEVFCHANSRVRYTTVQNWSTNVYNLVTKRAQVKADATMEWIDCNLGSKVTMKYPAAILIEPGARAEIMSLAMAGHGQEQDAGAKVIHLAHNTSSLITAKSVSHSGGVNSYRGLVKMLPRAKGSTSKVVCDALLLDDTATSNTYPTMDIRTEAQVEHEASVSRLATEQLFYLQSRGLTESEAAALIVNGFLEPVVKTLPMEYAIELNRLIELEMEGSVG